MASISPQQRALNRRSHGQNGSAMLSVQQQRELSPSPTHRERPRTNKTHSMPLVPSVQQIFPGTNSGPPTLVQQQSSPLISNIGPPPGRMLPIPPEQQNGQDHNDIPDRRPSSSPGPQYPISQNSVSTHYPRPIPRQPPGFLTQFESDQRLTEVFADIERADQQQSQNQFAASNAYSSPYSQPVHPGTPSPPKDPNVERLRNIERGSPNQPDPRRQREQTRESPKAQNRQPNSPGFTPQSGIPSPERRLSPAADSAPVYQREYGARDSPNAPKRPNLGADPRAATFTPPEQSIARTPDRSLPFQEEAEDDHYGLGSKNRWQGDPEARHGSSPTPSSDLNPDGNNLRYDHNQNQPSRQSDLKNSSKGLSSEDDSGTPRSPSVALPPADKYYHSQARLSPKNTIRVKTRNGSTDGLGLRSLTPSAFESPSSTLLSTGSQNSGYGDISQAHDAGQKQRQPIPSPPNQQAYRDDQTSSRAPAQYHSPPQPPPPQAYQQRQPQENQPRQAQPSQPASQGQQQQPQPQHAQKPQEHGDGPSHPPPTPDPVRNGNQYAYPGYGPPQVYPDDFQNHSEDGGNHYGYWQPYFVSPGARPDAPIPPTPHSQSAAPSPSPFPGAYGMMYSPIAPVGSPYPYPFTHIPRVPMGDPGRSQPPSNMNPNSRSALLRQEALHMRNYLENDIRANMTDTSSVISPAGTPFQGANYDPYAFVHTKFLRQAMDTMSIRSSPSHEPVPLPPAPVLRQRKPSGLRKQLNAPRKPPPRVESTIPRETTPEPVSSGEETAGEDHSVVNGTTSNGIGIHHSTKSTVWEKSVAKEEDEEDTEVQLDDHNGDWIDEDEDPDDDDMLDLEYHPNYVVNSDKRRRRWEVGWDTMVQAFQSLDRQTDATMVLMAAPAHSNKLYSVRSRSIRRTPTLANSANLRAMRSNFKNVSAKRKDLRPLRPMSLADKLRESQSSSGEGSDASSDSKTEDLRTALDTAVRGLNWLNDMFIVRESKLQDELRKMQEDKEKMGFVLQQLIGDDRLNGNIVLP